MVDSSLNRSLTPRSADTVMYVLHATMRWLMGLESRVPPTTSTSMPRVRSTFPSVSHSMASPAAFQSLNSPSRWNSKVTGSCGFCFTRPRARYWPRLPAPRMWIRARSREAPGWVVAMVRKWRYWGSSRGEREPRGRSRHAPGDSCLIPWEVRGLLNDNVDWNWDTDEGRRQRG